MKKEEFDQIVRAINSQKGSTCCHTMIVFLKNSFPNTSEQSLRSIYSQEVCRNMKFTHGRHKAKGAEYLKKYMEERSVGKSTLLTMAADLHFSPALLAKVILDAMACDSSEGTLTKCATNKMLRDTSLIDDRILAQDVHLCVLSDDHYGPLSDSISRSLGQQYEHTLGLQLMEKQIPFLAEDRLRELGLDKTPDIKLEVPVAVDGFVIHWIESKALFGSEEWHDRFVKKQLSAYWNRFGPGLVIYWYDYVDTIKSMHEKHLMVANCLPPNIVMMDPLKRP
ncbi:CDAN1-interacting nuclease 1 [Cloeon dipterum]|uniref:CDAN1-interacting nuclease 1 n=1 Tax=Cloeon dipterum TaxID=197152 RepID=UPI00321FBA5D